MRQETGPLDYSGSVKTSQGSQSDGIGIVTYCKLWFGSDDPWTVSTQAPSQRQQNEYHQMGTEILTFSNLRTGAAQCPHSPQRGMKSARSTCLYTSITAPEMTISFRTRRTARSTGNVDNMITARR